MSFNYWKTIKLWECASFQEGYVNPSQTKPEYFGNEVKWLRANDLNNSFVYDTSRKLSKSGFESAGKSAFLFKPNTLAISKSGTIGRLGILQDYMCGNRAVINIEVNPVLCDNLFIFYYLLLNQKLIEEFATGSVQKNLYISVLGELEISLPPLEIQKKISEVLSTIDKKAELNRQINKSLGEILFCLFQEICTTQSENLPNNWIRKPLGDFIEIKNGFAFKGTDFIDEGIPVLKIKNVKSGKVILENLSYVSREIANKAQRFRINQNDLLITMSGNRIDGTPETWVGKVGIFHRDGEYLLNQRVSILNILDEEIMSKYFLCQLLSTEEFQYYFISNATSSGGQANISPDLIYNTEIVVPPREAMQKFHHLAKDIYSKIFANELEIETLTNLRDTLLPKFLKGEIYI